MARIKLTLYEEGSEWGAELVREPVTLDDLTWEWLKGAFKAVGFNDDQVNEFFAYPSVPDRSNDPSVQEGTNAD